MNKPTEDHRTTRTMPAKVTTDRALNFRRWFEFDVRHVATGFQRVADELAAEIAGAPIPTYRTTGKVSAVTRWGAKRLIRARYRSALITILSVVPVKS